MTPELLQHLHAVFAWCLRTSLEASAVVLVILAVQGLLGRRLPARWHYGLWLILLLRLVLPWTPASSLSVFNALPDVALPSSGPIQAAAPLPAPSPAVTTLPTTAARPDVAPPAEAPGAKFGLREVLLVVWLGGALAFLVLVSVSSLRLWRRVWRAPTLEHAELRALLAECKRMLGVSTPVDLVALKGIGTPALLGFLRPRLVLPEDLPTRLSMEDLRFVFLHEIAHLKRNDILVNWLTTFLQAFHWFNPAIWYAFHCMRSDRELACDARALACLDEEEHRAYGFTVLRLLDQARHERPLPGMAGVAEDKSGLKRRITMIAFFGDDTRRWTVVALMVLLAVAPFVLTRAKAESQEKAPGERIVDNIDYAFADDPRVRGAWKTVDFVDKIEDFQPGRQTWQGELWLNHLLFEPKGVIDGNTWTWTRGHVLDADAMTDSAYTVKRILTQNGTPRDYLFLQWKSGDYTVRHMTPKYYVLAKVEPEELAGEPMFGKAARVESTSKTAPNGRIEDKIDYPFVDDPAVLGSWDSVDFVQEMEEFQPGQRRFQGDLYLKSLNFLPDGKMKEVWTWTKGLLLHPGDKTASKYELRNIDGKEYLFFEWKSGDYTIRRMKPQYYVLARAANPSPVNEAKAAAPPAQYEPAPQPVQEQAAEAPFLPEEWIEVPYVLDASGRRIDQTVWPIVDDPYVLGHWTSVDFVRVRESFRPEQRQWKGDLFLKELEFHPGGQTAKPWWTWTRGLVVHSGDQTAAHYFLRNIDGQDYLFFEWKSGDYSLRGMEPSYYVLRRDGPSLLPSVVTTPMKVDVPDAVEPGAPLMQEAAPEDAEEEAVVEAPDCATNLQRIGAMLLAYASGNAGRFPDPQPEPDHLMFRLRPLVPAYLTNPADVTCPLDDGLARELASAPANIGNLEALADRSRYWYLGYVLISEDEGMALANTLKSFAEAGRRLDPQRLPVLPDVLTAGVAESLPALRLGAEERLLAGSTHPEARARVLATIPVIVERPGNHGGAAHVLFMDGHVELMPYPGVFPMSERFIDALRSLDGAA